MRNLAVGEMASDIPVDARKSWNGTEILVRTGEKYRIDVSNEEWSDAGIKSTAAGQSGRGIQKIFRPLIRCHEAQWFELVAALGSSSQQMQPIGLGANVSFMTKEGLELGFFANDVIFMYWNKKGVIHVAITREA
jgi:hypothetical protein